MPSTAQRAYVQQYVILGSDRKPTGRTAPGLSYVLTLGKSIELGNKSQLWLPVEQGRLCLLKLE